MRHQYKRVGEKYFNWVKEDAILKLWNIPNGIKIFKRIVVTIEAAVVTKKPQFYKKMFAHAHKATITTNLVKDYNFREEMIIVYPMN